ncbi:GGDEF domain-containing protein [Parapedomonas caeni]
MVSTPTSLPGAVASGGVIGEIAAALLRRLDAREPLQQEGDRQLLAEILAFAADAERQIASHSATIDRMATISTLDPVTGLANRRGLALAFDRAAAFASRYGEPGVLVLVDVFGLVELERSIGPLGVEVYVRALAHCLSRQVRGSDLVARIEPHRFALLLERCPLEFATCKAAVIDEAIAELKVPYDGRLLSADAWLGSAPFGAGSTLSAALAAADRMTLDARYRTRNN